MMRAMRRTGLLALGAGLTFFATDVYLFAAMGAAGWNIDMFDQPDALLSWVYGHHRLYQGLWFLYFVSQALLLLVPWRLGEHLADRSTGLLGTVSVAIAMAGLVVLFAVSPITARSYHDGTDPATVFALHSVAADTAKDLRLFSEILLGVWLAVAGHQLRRHTGRRAWWALSALGAWTVVVAVWKLVDPFMPLEDWLGFLLGAAYVALGVSVLRTGVAGSRPVP